MRKKTPKHFIEMESWVIQIFRLSQQIKGIGTTILMAINKVSKVILKMTYLSDPGSFVSLSKTVMLKKSRNLVFFPPVWRQVQSATQLTPAGTSLIQFFQSFGTGLTSKLTRFPPTEIRAKHRLKSIQKVHSYFHWIKVYILSELWKFFWWNS